MEAALQKRKTAGNENTGLIKIIALICMMIDHAGVIFFPSVMEMRIIGRIAFPLYAWCAVVGACHTRSMGKYALRLLVTGVISQPFFMLALSHEWTELNIFATLLLGVLGIWGIRERKWGSEIWAPVLAILISCMFEMDYGWKGVLLILLLYLARNSKGGLAALMIAFCLYWGQGTVTVTKFFGLNLRTYYSFMPHGTSLLSSLTRIQCFAILSLPLMLLPMQSRIRLPKWVSYGVYPGHLLIYYLINHFL